MPTRAAPERHVTASNEQRREPGSEPREGHLSERELPRVATHDDHGEQDNPERGTHLRRLYEARRERSGNQDDGASARGESRWETWPRRHAVAFR